MYMNTPMQRFGKKKTIQFSGHGYHLAILPTKKTNHKSPYVSLNLKSLISNQNSPQ